MSAPPFTRPDRGLVRFRRALPGLACLASVVFFLWCVAGFYQRGTGFSSLISIGDLLDQTMVATLRQTPHFSYEKSPGYDGAYYVQLALNPTLNNPELTKAIDNLPYRARRILFCWVAWLLGLGQPAWVIQAHALLNVGCWLVLAWVLLWWFPPTTWGNYLRWAAVLFSHGLCMSVRHSLVDGPSLLLVALAMRWLEDGRRTISAVSLALAGLGRETSLLASSGVDFEWRSPRTWMRAGLTATLTALPLLAWMAYVRWKFGPADDPGMGNFALPFAGFVEKAQSAVRYAMIPDAGALHWATLAAIFALAVQGLFFALHWRPTERWWRVGATFALLLVFLSTPVWEGFPGASTRVLLPMTLAFNILVPRGTRWLPLLIAGNLTVAATVFEFSPPHDFCTVLGERSMRAAVRVVPASGWNGPEQHLSQHWRWSSGPAKLRLVNEAGQPLLATIRGQVSSAEGERSVRVFTGERLLWTDNLGTRPIRIQFGVVLPPGETVISFTSDRPAQKIGTDPRELAIRVANLEIVVTPPP